MELKDYISKVRTALAFSYEELEKIGHTIGEEYSTDVRLVTPVDTGFLKRDWTPQVDVINNAIYIKIVTDPVNDDFHYAEMAEAYYMTHTQNKRGGNKNSHRFRLKTEELWHLKLDERAGSLLNKYYKTILK